MTRWAASNGSRGSAKAGKSAKTAVSWTFTNRRGLKWSDGHPLDMESVKFAWELNLRLPRCSTRTFPLWASDPITQNPPKFNVVDDITWTLTYDNPIFTIMEVASDAERALRSEGACASSAIRRCRSTTRSTPGQAAIDQAHQGWGLR